MAQITIDATGVTKAALVEGGYDYCGLNGSEYERTPEEITTGLRRLNALMAALKAKGIDLGFVFPTYAEGLPEEPSGIPDDAVEPVCALLAQRLAPSIGAALTEDARAVLATAVQDLLANYAPTPPSMIPANRPRSSGILHQRLNLLDPAPITGDPGDLSSIVSP